MKTILLLLSLLLVTSCSTPNKPPAPPTDTSVDWEWYGPEDGLGWSDTGPETILPDGPYDAEVDLGYAGPQYAPVPPWYHMIGTNLLGKNATEWFQLISRETPTAMEAWRDERGGLWHRTTETATDQSKQPIFKPN